MTTDRRPIDIRRYMEIRSAYGPSFAHDDRGMFFLSTITGTAQVWRLDPDTSWPRQVTFFPDRVMGNSASPAGDRILVSTDRGGNERSQLLLMDGEGLDMKDVSRDPEHIYTFGAWSPDGTCFTYASNRRNGKDFDVYLHDLETGSHRLLHQSDHTHYAGRFSPDGRMILFSRVHTNMDNDLYLLDLNTKKARLLTPHMGEARFTSARFSPDGGSLYLLSNKESEFTRVARVNLQTGSWKWLTEDRWDAETLTLSPDGRYLAFSLNEGGISRLRILHCERSEFLDLPNLPEGVILDATWNRRGTALAFTLTSPRHGTEIWQLSEGGRKRKRLTYASISGVPQETFVSPEPVTCPSFDGLKIPAFYYRPSGRQGSHPVLIWVHGGPESQSRNGFNPLIQYFLHRGMAVFVPNVRGSSGYGRTYVHLDDVRKRMDSVADLAWCVEWLKKQGDVQEDAIAVMGGSYGGFMVLAGLTHYPDLWAAGVDIVGIANLRTFIRNTGSYRRHLRESEYGTIGEDGEFFDQISPIHHVDRIRAPLFVVHGANDPRVPVTEAEQIVDALRKRNRPVEYLRFEDEGHGLSKLENRVHAYGEIATFLEKWLLKNGDETSA
ncbi:dipeptidyl aminopeptidase/acylaminoacyl peptidase [Melghirimyces profundicolus]|uniref:Dipeptidyl aminopeptidase/acylaminoacyl peptidase n=1 Tax=Melghirimyces profundicolus TaxID=1242148 RepID=A0A2T6C0D4_9BACL|nr:S9 family peptidase [Melghirimyces profundicolus]PTX61784.1 dipeptidyl aminopeptidase/acylaminoacyl peptidase [Melghirimyces profundicolus]